ncbi:MAG: ABC transporter substrate-binding protein, partial [Clostridia bacterium]|nr:ABC transporter substrate-binding protein [Clostridia bacterium]
MTLLAAGCGGRAGGGSGTTAPGGAQGTAASQPQGGGEKQATDEKGEIIKLGISAPMSGAAASWGKTMEWVAKEAAKKVNAEGGVQADGKRYMFEVVAYDNKYTAAEGTKVAQTMVNRDKVKFVVGAVGSAPVLAMQSVTEPAKVIMFSTAWSREARGPEKPYTFTSLNTPVEVMEPLYSWILQNHKDLKTVAILNPKDATGTDTMAVSEATWKRHGIQILAQEYYERGTTE